MIFILISTCGLSHKLDRSLCIRPSNIFWSLAYSEDGGDDEGGHDNNDDDDDRKDNNKYHEDNAFEDIVATLIGAGRLRRGD